MNTHTNHRLGPVTALCAAAAALLLTACSSEDPEPGPDEAVVVGEDPWILVHDFSGGPQAQLYLELEYRTEQECLLVHGIDPETDEIAYSGVPVWPKGVQPLDEDGQVGVLVPDHGPLADGDTFTAGGAPGAQEEPPAGVEIPEQDCSPDGGFVPLNAESIAEDSS